MRARVDAKINGKPAVLALDSGAFYSMLTPSAATEYNLALSPAPIWLNVIGVGGSVSVSVAKIRAFEVAGRAIPNIEFLVGGSEIGNNHLGLIGQNLLGAADVEYDLSAGVVNVMRPHHCDKLSFAYWSKSGDYRELNIEPDDGPYSRKIRADVYINGTKVSAIFDTGAPGSVISLKTAQRVGINMTDPGVKADGFSGGLGKNTGRLWIAPVASFKIADEEIRKTQLRVSETLGRSGNEAEMLIGADFFLSHHIYVANSQHKMYFTYNGGMVFSTKPSAPGEVASAATQSDARPNEDVKAPADAEGLERRAAARFARRDFALAIADYSAAILKAPSSASAYLGRARAYAANRQPYLAMGDLDQAIKLKPDDAQALIERAAARGVGNDKVGAAADLAAADKLLARVADARFFVAELYVRLGAEAEALEQFNIWIAEHREDSKLGSALAGRCWSRALLNTALDDARKDCDRALKMVPVTFRPGVLDSRGLVALRQGLNEEAIADYAAALAVRPRMVWSLYGRGLAKQRKGLIDEGKADVAAAIALDPTIVARAAKYAITP